MAPLLLLLGLALLFSALGFDTSVPDVAARIRAAFTPAPSWRFARAVLAAAFIAVAAASSATATHRPHVNSPVAPAADAKSVYAAVAAFQKAHGLKPDGVVGPKTCPLLYTVCPVI